MNDRPAMTGLKTFRRSRDSVSEEEDVLELLSVTPQPDSKEAFNADHDASPLSPSPLDDQARRRKRSTQSFIREMLSQTVPMIFLSLVSSVLAGELIAHLKSWPIFLRVPELFILVPILLNLKGNIEMNLAARFSTSANIGELDIRLTRRTLVMGNLALLQVQALLVSLLAGLIAFLLGLASRVTPLPTSIIDPFSEDRGGYFECVMVLAASMIAASVSSALVGSFMCALVILSRKAKINPDNIATPLAASLGDLVSLALLGVVASRLGSVESSLLSTFILIGLITCIGINVWFVLKNAYVQELLWSGWVPLLLAMVISSGTGLILEKYVNAFKGYGLIAPVVTAVIGNVGAILVSRISTSLHSTTYSSSPHMLTAITLFIIATPILCLFLTFAVLTNQVNFSILFTIFYIILCALGVALSLCVAWGLALGLWNANFDPDINALPLHSAAMDVCGQVLLAFAFSLAGMSKPPVDPALLNPTPSSNSTVVSAIVTSIAPVRVKVRQRQRRLHQPRAM